MVFHCIGAGNLAAQHQYFTGATPVLYWGNISTLLGTTLSFCVVDVGSARITMAESQTFPILDAITENLRLVQSRRDGPPKRGKTSGVVPIVLPSRNRNSIRYGSYSNVMETTGMVKDSPVVNGITGCNFTPTAPSQADSINVSNSCLNENGCREHALKDIGEIKGTKVSSEVIVHNVVDSHALTLPDDLNGPGNGKELINGSCCAISKRQKRTFSNSNTPTPDAVGISDHPSGSDRSDRSHIPATVASGHDAIRQNGFALQTSKQKTLPPSTCRQTSAPVANGLQRNNVASAAGKPCNGQSIQLNGQQHYQLCAATNNNLSAKKASIAAHNNSMNTSSFPLLCITSDMKRGVMPLSRPFPPPPPSGEPYAPRRLGQNSKCIIRTQNCDVSLQPASAGSASSRHHGQPCCRGRSLTSQQPVSSSHCQSTDGRSLSDASQSIDHGHRVQPQGMLARSLSSPSPSSSNLVSHWCRYASLASLLPLW